jgi:hypothetical protein
MSALDALTENERDTLSQLQAITEGADVDTQISLLQSVDWDLQVSCWTAVCDCSTSFARGLSAKRLMRVSLLGCTSSYLWR